MSGVQNFPAATGPAVRSVTAKLGLYRECLKLSAAISDKRIRNMTFMEVREKWRENKGLGGPSLELAIASVLDRMAYVRLCTPKAALRTIPDASLKYEWKVKNPLENYHKIVSRADKESPTPGSDHGEGHRDDFVPLTNWGAGNVDPDMVKRHKELLDRQFFMGPHWRGKPKPLIYEDLSFDEQIAVHFSAPEEVPKRIRKQY